MFHFYFTGNPRGLVFDVAREPFGTSIFGPLRRHLEKLGARIVTGATVHHVEGTEGAWSVVAEQVEPGSSARPLRVAGENVVLALAVPALRDVVSASPCLAAIAPGVSSLDVTAPFVVLRLWLDRPCLSSRAPFAATAGYGILDNISLFDRFEGESRAWATRTGGSVVELHAYAIEPARSEDEVRSELLAQLHRVYPETRSARIVEERLLVRRDCPAFRPGSHARRPTVRTELHSMQLAGDFVRLDFPSALMERAVTSGFLAANLRLEQRGLPPVPVASASGRGLLAGLARWLDGRVRKKARAGHADPPA
jgi:isorenieratene synthase